MKEEAVLFIDSSSSSSSSTSSSAADAGSCSRLSPPCLLRCCRAAWVPANWYVY